MAETNPLEALAIEPGAPVSDADLPRITVVILNHNGRHHLAGCFDSLQAADYPVGKLDVLLFDNGSDDGSHLEMKTHHGWVRFVANDTNLGFAGGCNRGADLSQQAEVLVFLNNDMRIEPPFLRELVAPIVRGECRCTAGKMLSWDGKLINSAGGGMNFHGIGIQTGYLEQPGPQHDVPRKTLFACGGAMAIDAALFRTIGGFDPEFFAYYEDVDLGWRLWLSGYEIHYAPRAVVYHRHSSTSRAFPLETVRLLQVRNPLLACFKNYDDQNLARVLPAMLALATRRALLVSGFSDDKPFRIQHARAESVNAARRIFSKLRKKLPGTIPIRRVAAADLVGINDLLGNWEHWMKRRAEVQRRRVRPDSEILPLFLKPLWCVEEEPAYGALQRGLEDFLGLDTLFEGLSMPGPDPHK